MRVVSTGGRMENEAYVLWWRVEQDGKVIQLGQRKIDLRVKVRVRVETEDSDRGWYVG